MVDPQLSDNIFADQQKKLLFVCSAGGHLSQLLQLKPWWTHHRRHWVSFKLPDVESKLVDEEVSFAHFPTTRNVLNLMRNIPLAYRTINKLKPDLIVSNGAGVAFPFFLLAKFMGIPTVYMEVYDRIESKTLTGRLCKPLSSLFLVQWPEQHHIYRGSVLVGSIY
jgi:UDP-N-acetylglucosamine:LPS N-acetylglucosamine transferase